MSDDTTTLDLSGAAISIDGEVHYVDEGELTVEMSYIRNRKDVPIEPTGRQVEIDVDLYRPDDPPEYEQPSQGMTTAGGLIGPPARDGWLYLALRLQRLGVKDRLRSIHPTPEDAFEAIIDHAGTEPDDYDPDWPDGDWGGDVWGWNTDDGVTYIIQQYRWSGVNAPGAPEWLTEEDIGE